MAKSQDQIKKQRFQEFLAYFNQHITGDEKGEGQLFFENLLQAFGNAGVKQVGAVCEERVKKRSGKTGFADLVWKPRVVIELKKRGEKLNKHYEQALEYWLTLVPNRPEYMILCNFDEFWIYDLNEQLNDPVHKLDIQDLSENWGCLNFLFPQPEKPIFDNHNIEVTKEVAKDIGQLYFSLAERGIPSEKAQRFVLQLVVALFSEDVELLPKYALQKLLKKSAENPSLQKELKKLFVAMATKRQSSKPRNYQDIPYFNGGIFNFVEPVELEFSELNILMKASKQNWAKVRPSIFGSIFEESMNSAKRHSHGVHFTSELDIQKIVQPTIVRPFREKIEKARTKKQKEKVLKELANFRVLDPACGSGNFLYVAYRELSRLEMELRESIDNDFNKQRSFSKMTTDESKFGKRSHVSPINFYGIDTNKFGIEVAKIALSIGQKLVADEFNISENVLPFQNLDENFSDSDALFNPWPECEAIIGNPPFLGSRKMRDSGFSDDYIKNLWKLYPDKKDFPKGADYCCYWFRKAHEQKAIYIGLVGSNSITQNQSRTASLGYIVRNQGIIHNAINTQPWSGKAKVHVSIVNWTKKSWSENFFLDNKKVSQINSSLKDELDVSSAKKIIANKDICFQGVV